MSERVREEKIPKARYITAPTMKNFILIIDEFIPDSVDYWHCGDPVSDQPSLVLIFKIMYAAN